MGVALLLGLSACGDGDDVEAAGEGGDPDPSAQGSTEPDDAGSDADGAPDADAAHGTDADSSDDDAADDEEGRRDRAADAGADEAGRVPVLMYHRLLDDGGGDFDNTPEGFRAELTRLHEAGYVPITTAELVSGRIDVPAGTTPVVLTFDDSTREQFGLDEDGEVLADTAVGIMLDLGDELDGFEPTGSFYVLSSLFGSSGERGAELLAALHDLGFEVGNHTASHANLAQLDAAGVQRELAEGQANIRAALGDDVEVTTMSLPFGINPEDRSLLAAGEHDGQPYTHDAALLVGSGPAPSPFHTDFDPLAIPRIRSQPDWQDGDEVDYGSGFWLTTLEDSEDRYVSDGDPDTVAVPEARRDELGDVDPERIVTY